MSRNKIGISIIKSIFISFIIQVILVVSILISNIQRPAISSQKFPDSLFEIKFEEYKPKFEEIVYVYHHGGSYIDPVDPTGERCLVPWDYTRDITKASFIMYNVLDNRRMINRPRDPKLRPDQVTCIESMESNTNFQFKANRKNFNFTMDYSLTSDVPIPYSEYFESSKEPLPLTNKSGNLVAAFISNCHARNGRLQYLRELASYIKIDSYGRCFHNANVAEKFGRGRRDTIKEKVISHYKFTVAFENSDDDDYITEKLYQPLRFGSVPIFRGCRNVEDFAPPHSVIDANKFNSAKELADYLLYLDQNDTAYNEYLEWKKSNSSLGNLVKVRFFRDRYEYGVCALLERMHGLWINPYLTDWNRTTEAELGCNKCLKDFDLSKRRIPKLRKDGWSYDLLLPKRVIVNNTKLNNARSNNASYSNLLVEKMAIFAEKLIGFFNPFY